jgi:metal-sulfur cluster biosynthetic enzyme
MQKLSVKDVANALRNCLDPELGVNIVEIGLIQDIKVDSRNNIRIRLTMTSPMCPMTSIILADAQLRLEQLPDHGRVELELVWEPAWTPGMMGKNLRETIGL